MWRFWKIPYLEQVCTCNLRQLSVIMKQIRSFSEKAGLKPSFCYYKRWGVKKKQGHKPVLPLRFSKSGKPEIEKAYATHYVDRKRVEELKKEKRAGYRLCWKYYRSQPENPFRPSGKGFSSHRLPGGNG